ncbi:MAG: host specificity protein J [Pseudobdellovibrionaceae bacterium]
MKKIIGSGSGKSGGGSVRVAQEDQDSLRSVAFAQVLDLISEGEIEGLVNGMQSIFLDSTPLENPDGSLNFEGVLIDFRPGSQHQTYIPGFPNAENEVNVGVEVKASAPVVRSISTPNIDAIYIKISLPQLTYQDPSTGDLRGSTVAFAIEVNSNSSGWVQKANDTIIGKCVSKYQKSYRIDLPAVGPHQVRVRRITADSTQSILNNKTFWDSYTEVIDVKLSYPNSAIMGIQVDAKYFSSIPTRSYDMKLLKIQVPSNYDPVLKNYTGIWDGTFQIAWTDNPAWIFYDLATNTRYGLGNNVDPSLVDKWTLYQIGKYCDEFIPDGFGSYEPRFSCNVYFQTRTEAYNILKDLASVFRAITYWSGGLLTLSQDAPQDAEYLFSPSNVIGGDFHYQGTSKKDRYTVALVTWNDPDDMCRPKVEYVEDEIGIAKYGVIASEVVAFGCISRGQAHRFGKWLLFTSSLETETITFQTGLEGAVVRPGQVIKVQDPMRAGERMSGRVSSSTTTHITLDQVLVLGTDTYTLSMMLPDGTIAERQIQSVSGNVVELSTPLTVTPHDQSIWMVTANTLQPQYFRIISITEDKGIYSITALAHEPTKYAFIERDIQLEERSITSLSLTPDVPVGLKITETLYETNGEVKVKATFSWDSAKNAASYSVQYKADGGNLIDLGTTRSNEMEVFNIDPGIYTFYVTAFSPLGAASSDKPQITYQVIGKAFPPDAVSGFSLIPVSGMAYLSWNKSTDLDVLIGGSVRIRWSSNLGGTWKESVDVALLSGSSTRAQVPLMNGTYLAKFIDSSGNASLAPAVIETSVLEANLLNVVFSLNEDPGFIGTKTTMRVDTFYGGLMIDAALNIDDWTGLIDDSPTIDFIGGVATQGSYDLSQIVDLTQVYTSNISASMLVSSVDVADTIDLRMQNVDTWLDMDGDLIDDVNAEIYVQTTLDDPNSIGATWSEWKRFFIGEYKARGFKFKVIATSSSDNHNIIIKKLSVSIDMPDRTVSIAGILSSTLGSAVVFEAPFAATPAIGITGHNLVSGDYYTVTGKTNSGFTITFYNSSGTPVQRTFDYIAKGYGRKV